MKEKCEDCDEEDAKYNIIYNDDSTRLLCQDCLEWQQETEIYEIEYILKI